MTGKVVQPTPGPWEAADLTGRPVNDPSVMSAKHCIATVWINDISRKQAVANARLLAASWDLLEACKEALGGLDSEFGQRATDVNFPLLRAAIAKAGAAS